MNNILYYISLIMILLLPTNIYATPHCGELRNPYGPFDYTNSEHRKVRLNVVEDYHFTKDVENLDSRFAHVGGDIDYTLRAFPNHHRALLAMSKLAIRDKTHKPKGARYTALCYFDRAIRFKPNDPTTYAIFSSHLLKIGKNKQALQQLEVAEKLDPKNANVKYNLGLIYFKKKKYDKSMSYAKEAYALGFPLPGLRNKLKRIGRWVK